MKLDVDINCANCNRKIKVKLAEMNSGKKKICTGCKTEINFTGNGGRKAQKAMDDFDKTLKKLFK